MQDNKSICLATKQLVLASGFSAVPEDLLLDPSISDAAKVLAGFLLSKLRRQWHALVEVTQNTIASALGWGLRKVQRKIKELQKSGILFVQKVQDGIDRYGFQAFETGHEHFFKEAFKGCGPSIGPQDSWAVAGVRNDVCKKTNFGKDKPSEVPSSVRDAPPPTVFVQASNLSRRCIKYDDVHSTKEDREKENTSLHHQVPLTNTTEQAQQASPGSLSLPLGTSLHQAPGSKSSNREKFGFCSNWILPARSQKLAYTENRENSKMPQELSVSFGGAGTSKSKSAKGLPKELDDGKTHPEEDHMPKDMHKSTKKNVQTRVFVRSYHQLMIKHFPQIPHKPSGTDWKIGRSLLSLLNWDLEKALAYIKWCFEEWATIRTKVWALRDSEVPDFKIMSGMRTSLLPLFVEKVEEPDKEWMKGALVSEIRKKDKKDKTTAKKPGKTKAKK